MSRCRYEGSEKTLRQAEEHKFVIQKSQLEAAINSIFTHIDVAEAHIVGRPSGRLIGVWLKSLVF